MYAIIETGGTQYWVKPGQNLQVADAKAGNTAKVTAQVVKHLRGPKILVFKKRPKKGYERTIGHRQDLTQIKITDIQLA